jgi:acetoin:2,6-dichlorophenolindophenol oxidoreductase subunit alpha
VQLSGEQLLRSYGQMAVIRAFEERLHNEVMTGVIAGFNYLCCGQEAAAVGVCEHIADDDFIVSIHHGHGHCIAKVCDVKSKMKEIYGCTCCADREPGTSVTLHKSEKWNGLFRTN